MLVKSGRLEMMNSSLLQNVDDEIFDYSQGSRLVVQSVVFQLIFATLNMFLENTQVAGRKHVLSDKN